MNAVPDTEAPFPPARDGDCVLPGDVELVENPLYLIQVDPARAGQFDLVILADEELEAEFLFQLLDLSADWLLPPTSAQRLVE